MVHPNVVMAFLHCAQRLLQFTKNSQKPLRFCTAEDLLCMVYSNEQFMHRNQRNHTNIN